MKAPLAALVLLLLAGSAFAQDGLMLPPSVAQQNAQTQAELNARQQQTELNTLKAQQSNLENQLSQQRLFSPPAYMFNQYAVTPPPPTPRP